MCAHQWCHDAEGRWSGSICRYNSKPMSPSPSIRLLSVWYMTGSVSWWVHWTPQWKSHWPENLLSTLTVNSKTKNYGNTITWIQPPPTTQAQNDTDAARCFLKEVGCVLSLCPPPLVRDVNTRPGPGALLCNDFTVPQDVFKQRIITVYHCDRSAIM